MSAGSTTLHMLGALGLLAVSTAATSTLSQVGRIGGPAICSSEPKQGSKHILLLDYRAAIVYDASLLVWNSSYELMPDKTAL